VYFGCAVSPPSLMDDVDAAVVRISENMVTKGDWVTPRSDGIAFLEKPAMFYWPIAVSFKIFGIHDWAARIPFALAAVALACLACGFGMWAFGPRAGLYAGLCMATCIGLFLFTRIVIPDAMLTLSIGVALWAFLRTMEEEEQILEKVPDEFVRGAQQHILRVARELEAQGKFMFEVPDCPRFHPTKRRKAG